MVSMEAGGSGAGVVVTGVGIGSRVARSSPEEENPSSLVAIFSALLCFRPHGGRQLFVRETVNKGEMRA